jgi:hypothetical protein
VHRRRAADFSWAGVTPTVIFKLKNFQSRRSIAGDVLVSMPKTTLAFVKGA